MSPKNIQKYLSRIGIEKTAPYDVFFLKELHRRHLFTAPFENLSIHNNEKIILDTENFFEKIIINKRGGFCYELNGLFYELITSLGFNSKMISARVFNKEGIPGPEFDHMALIVEIDRSEYLCDVGFGDLCIEPLKFIPDEIQYDSDKQFKIIKENKNDFKLLRSENPGEWIDQYLFTTQPRELKEFEEMCNYHQTSQQSHFTQNKICSRATSNGRITLRDDKLILTENGTRIELPVKDEIEFRNQLKKYFDIEL